MSAPSADSPALSASTSSSGYTDGLGRRALAFDREDGTMLERLVVRAELSAFERSLRERVERISAMDDERVARPRSIERADDGALVVLSEFVPGSRLADLLETAAQQGVVPGVDVALGYLLDLLPALCALHAGAGFAHGAISPGRTVVTPAGQVVLLDAIFGDALTRLQCNRQRLWIEFGIAMPPAAGPPRFDVASDIAQAVLSAVMLVAGRPLRTDEYPDSIPLLLVEVVDVAQIRGGDEFSAGVQRFLQRSLPLPGRRPYTAADDALFDVRALARGMGIDACRRSLIDFVEQVESGGQSFASTFTEEPFSENLEDADVPSEVETSSADAVGLSFEADIDLDAPSRLEPDIDAPSRLEDEPVYDLTLPSDIAPETTAAFDTAASAELLDPATSYEPSHDDVSLEEIGDTARDLVSEPAEGESAQPEVVVEAPERIEPEPQKRSRRRRRPRSARSRKDTAAAIKQPAVAEVPVMPPLHAPTPTPTPPPAVPPVGVDGPAAPPEPPRPLASPQPTPPPPIAPAASTWLLPHERAAAFESPVSAFASAPAQPQDIAPPSPRPAPVPLPIPTFVPVPHPVVGPPAVPFPPSAAPPAAPPRPPVSMPKLKADAPGDYPQARHTRYEGIDEVYSRRTPDAAPEREGRFPWKLAAAAMVVVGVGVVAGRAYIPDRSTTVHTPESVAAPAPAAGPPPVVATKTGRIQIETQPPGARVLLNGKHAGESPLNLEVPVGRHTLTLASASGSVRRTVRVEAGKTIAVDVPIFSGWVDIVAPIILDVSEGGRSIGTTEQSRLLLRPGRHELVFSNRELDYSSSHTVDIEPGDVRTITLDPRGTVNLNASPWAEVLIDGKKVGETPLANLQVPLGTHEIVFRHPQFGERRVTTTVRAGAPVAVSMDMSRP